MKKRKKSPKVWMKMPSMSKQEAVRFIEDYGKEHFLNDKVKDIKIKTRVDDFYIYATTWNDYLKQWQEDPVARIKWLKNDTYILGYFRHTGKWWDISALIGTIKECLEWIKENELGLFWL